VGGSEERQDEVPRYIIVSDFARIALHDLEPEEQQHLPLVDGRRIRTLEFPLTEMHKQIHAFGFIPGYQQHRFEDQDPINLKAVDIMGRLHDTLEAGGYSGHKLERFLVRILFCLFADDTGIFEREAFRLYIVNRALFEENLGFADFNRDMRNALLAATRFDWSRISPAVFGSLFQAVMEPRERRQVGGHYTSERDILKVIRALFLIEILKALHGSEQQELDWKLILPPEQCSYVLGNPPFVGKKARNAEQQSDMEIVFGAISGTKVLDYVCCWYVRAAQYLSGTRTTAGLVSTNSVTQGEQPGILWPILFKMGIKIHFAHRTFAWESEARGKAHVHVVIIGFAAMDTSRKTIFDYETSDGQVTTTTVRNIGPYLIEGSDLAMSSRERPISNVPEILFGNMPNDNGNLLLTDEERLELLKSEPAARKYLRPFLSAWEYLHDVRRWCLWLKDIPSQEFQALPLVHARVVAVRHYRSASKREATKRLASFPMLFGEIRQPDSEYILIPRHSSENRRYIPMSYFSPDVVVGDSCLFVSDATKYYFGVLNSEMHMAFVRQVCGRLKSDYRYSNKLVYNNYPWPENPTDKQRLVVETAAQTVLDVRAAHQAKGATLADLYDPIAMPPDLVKAHAAHHLYLWGEG